MGEGISWIAFLLSSISVIVNVATWFWLYKYRGHLFQKTTHAGQLEQQQQVHHLQQALPPNDSTSPLSSLNPLSNHHHHHHHHLLHSTLHTNGNSSNGGSDPLLSHSNSRDELDLNRSASSECSGGEDNDHYPMMAMDEKLEPMVTQRTGPKQSQSTSSPHHILPSPSTVMTSRQELENVVREMMETQMEGLRQSMLQQWTRALEQQKSMLLQEFNQQINEVHYLIRTSQLQQQQQEREKEQESSNPFESSRHDEEESMSSSSPQSKWDQILGKMDQLDQTVNHLSQDVYSQLKSLSQAMKDMDDETLAREKRTQQVIALMEERLKQQEELVMMIDSLSNIEAHHHPHSSYSQQSQHSPRYQYHHREQSSPTSQMSIPTSSSPPRTTISPQPPSPVFQRTTESTASSFNLSPPSLPSPVNDQQQQTDTEPNILSASINPFDTIGIHTTIAPPSTTSTSGGSGAEQRISPPLDYDISTSSSNATSDEAHTPIGGMMRNAITDSIVTHDYFYESDEQPVQWDSVHDV